MPSATSTSPGFTCKDEPIENQRPLTVRVIGAGYSGVYLGIRIPQRLRNVDLQIYEKNDGIGAHSYQYSFAPNKRWTSFYAPSAEICDYIQNIAETYGATRFIKLHHEASICT
ncbi:putative flavin-binding monooxygenase protein [Phaeoacremonium minimum UCRPA7]|uniref:Putative flavin-binding monooxygenase protein n=1 Tax=Phaeoacremonium minimum (strain UCR-PA7) TaxID=1286976 RepID=R8BGW6_PHAM7|nr:putative flavin-binding monooxygenase protein [Phaeoacremonium minimum UCRPA7]EON98585.1 putative flavin-binding monooxygenase protein [Phaeoacremonium minimum UCRPA7]